MTIAGSRGSGRTRHTLISLALPLAVAVIVIGGWQSYVSLSGVSSLSLPGPGEVLQRVIADAPLLVDNAWVTLQAVLLGYLCAVILGGLIAALVHASTIVERAITPWLVVSQMIPLPAIAPRSSYGPDSTSVPD
jgi:NitT/TauT family transport system permease protein